MSVIDKVKDMIKGNEDKVKSGVDKAADMANEKTGGKYAGQIDSAKEKLNEKIGGQPKSDDEGDDH